MQGKTSLVLPRRTALMALLPTVRTLYGRVSARTRATALLDAALLAAGKIVAVLVAVHIAAGDARGALILGFVATAAYAVARLVATNARVSAECDLQRTTTEALLESDVLDPQAPPLRTLFEPLYHARALLTELVPELAASLVAAVAIAPVLASALPPRVLAVSAVAGLVVLSALVVASRRSADVQRGVLEAFDVVQERSGFAIEARLELVARGAERSAMRALEESIGRYRTVAMRAAWTSALLGRAPLAAGLVAVVLAVVADASYRDAITSAILGQALVLAACLPILLGLVFRANELVRVSAVVRPLLGVLSAPRRPELSGTRAAPPELPAAVTVRDVVFSYAEGAPPTLDSLSLEWPRGEALFVVGPNGTGKSTLLRLLLALRSPQRGAITVGGADLESLDVVTLRAGIAYLPQRPYLGESHATVRTALCALGDERDDGALHEVLARVGLAAAARKGDLLDTAVGELSAGQRQRLALARILLQDARIYLLDEPDANLDRAGIAMVGEIVRELLTRGRMVAVAAHTQELDSIPGPRITFTS